MNPAIDVTTALPSSSLHCGELFAALAKAQAAMETALKTSDNPFFKSKYADFAEVVRASRPALTANGLCVIQRVIKVSDTGEGIHSIVGHVSGQYIDSLVMLRPTKNDAQSLGSYITYIKRYAYCALVGVAVADEDDDGETAMGRGKHSGHDSHSSKHEQGSPRAKDNDGDNMVSPEQLELLRDALKLLPNPAELEKSILSAYKISDLAQLMVPQYFKVMDHVKKLLKQ
jgi:hypothetical protein